jgi:hypothetical protein
MVARNPHNFKTQMDLHSPAHRTNENSLSRNATSASKDSYLPHTKIAASSISAKYQQSQVKLQQLASNYARQSIPSQLSSNKSKNYGGNHPASSVANSFSRCDNVRSSSSSPLRKEDSLKAATPLDQNSPLTKVHQGFYTKSNKQSRKQQNKYGGGATYSSLN